MLAAKLAADLDVVWLERSGGAGVALASGVQRVQARKVEELASWLAGADLMVSNHGAAVQVAAGLGCPGVVIAGPTHPEWDPVSYAERFLILRAPGLACLPCDQHRNPAVRCLNTETPMACMKHWAVEEVEARCRSWLARMAQRDRTGTRHPWGR